MDDIGPIAVKMLIAGLPENFVLRAVAVARESEGVADMMHLWSDEETVRDAVIAEIQASLDDREPREPHPEVRDTEAAERLIESRMRQKAHIRALVESHGGVSRVAQAAGLPQPSLSRFLNTLSEPRPATLHRLAQAMGLRVEDLSSGSTSMAAVYALEPMRIQPAYRPHPTYKHRRVRT